MLPSHDLLGNTSPSSNAWKIGQDCKRVESCMEPRAPTPAHKKRLLCPISRERFISRQIIRQNSSSDLYLDGLSV